MDSKSPPKVSFHIDSHGIIDRIRSTKRRFIQQTLHKIGKATSSDDHEYQALRERQLELVQDVEHVFLHMKNFVTTLVSLGYGCTLLGEDMTSIRTDQNTKAATSQSFGVKTFNENTANEFSKSMNVIDIAARELANSMLSTSVVVNMQTKMDELHQFKKELDHRENLKLDYDSAVRKLKIAREKREASDVLRRDEKLRNAHIKLKDATDLMVIKMKQYEDGRSTMLQNELNEFRSMQVKFFNLCIHSFAGETMTIKKSNEIDQTESINPFEPWK